MRTNFAFLCDAAAQGAEGKISALGIGISQLHAQQVPVQRAQIVLVAQIGFNADEAGTKQLAVRLIDADGGNVIAPVDGQLVFNAPEGALSPVAQVLLEFSMVTFPKFGVYSVDLSIDGQSIASLPLEVLLLQTSQA